MGMPGVQGNGVASQGGSAAKEAATVMEWAGLSTIGSAGNVELGRLPYDAEEDADLPQAIARGGPFQHGQQMGVRGLVLEWVSSSKMRARRSGRVQQLTGFSRL